MILGIEIGGTKLQLVLGERDGTIHQRFRFKVAREAAAEGIRRQIAETLVEIRKRGSIEAVGIGLIGIGWLIVWFDGDAVREVNRDVPIRKAS